MRWNVYTAVPMTSRYKLVTQNKNWLDAHAYCASQHDAKMVVIANQLDLLRLQSYIDSFAGLSASLAALSCSSLALVIMSADWFQLWFYVPLDAVGHFGDVSPSQSRCLLRNTRSSAIETRCVVSVEILPIATQQCRNYLYDKSWTNRSYEVGGLQWLVDSLGYRELLFVWYYI